MLIIFSYYSIFSIKFLLTNYIFFTNLELFFDKVEFIVIFVDSNFNYIKIERRKEILVVLNSVAVRVINSQPYIVIGNDRCLI